MKTLYKFVGSQGAVHAIARGSLKFTKIDELNDPSELVPLMNRDAVRDSLAAVRKDGYTEKQFEWLGCQEATLRLLSPETRVLSRPATIELANRTLALPIYNKLDLMEQQLLRTISSIRLRVGILSLTARFDSLPMWAHYGAQAKGYVMRFDGLDREFSGDATGSLNALKPVQYVEDLVGMTHDPSSQDNLFFCKFQDWNYEREWRVVSALSACQLSADGKMHLRPVSLPTITGVICGWNVPADEIHSLATELHRINPGLKICAASLDRGHVVLRDTSV
jgi:hypothetical protein